MRLMGVGKKDDELNHQRKKNKLKKMFEEAGPIHNTEMTDIKL